MFKTTEYYTYSLSSINTSCFSCLLFFHTVSPCPFLCRLVAHDCCEVVLVTLCSVSRGVLEAPKDRKPCLGHVAPLAEHRFSFVQDLAFDMAQFLVSKTTQFYFWVLKKSTKTEASHRREGKNAHHSLQVIQQCVQNKTVRQHIAIVIVSSLTKLDVSQPSVFI